MNCQRRGRWSRQTEGGSPRAAPVLSRMRGGWTPLRATARQPEGGSPRATPVLSRFTVLGGSGATNRGGLPASYPRPVAVHGPRRQRRDKPRGAPRELPPSCRASRLCMTQLAGVKLDGDGGRDNSRGSRREPPPSCRGCMWVGPLFAQPRDKPRGVSPRATPVLSRMRGGWPPLRALARQSEGGSPRATPVLSRMRVGWTPLRAPARQTEGRSPRATPSCRGSPPSTAAARPPRGAHRELHPSADRDGREVTPPRWERRAELALRSLSAPPSSCR
jgi:hypothetical protein